MQRLTAVVIILVLIGKAPVQAAEAGKPPPREPALSKDFVAEAYCFLRAAHSRREKWDRVPDQCSGARYDAGVKDRACSAAVAWVVVSQVFRQGRTP